MLSSLTHQEGFLSDKYQIALVALQLLRYVQAGGGPILKRVTFAFPDRRLEAVHHQTERRKEGG